MKHIVIALATLIFALLAGCGEKEEAAPRAEAASSQPAYPKTTLGKRVALVIGNKDYKQEGAALQRPVKDADSVAAALRTYRFTLLDNKVHTNLDKNAMKTLLLHFEQTAKGADVALVYYAGHGVQDKGANYLVPVDAQIGSTAQIEDQSVDLGLVLNHL